jgi:hypothetical protein
MTAKECRDKNPDLKDNGNIRDYTDILHLIILNNLEVLNANMIENNISQRERLIKLNNIAQKQMELIIKILSCILVQNLLIILYQI